MTVEARDLAQVGDEQHWFEIAARAEHEVLAALVLATRKDAASLVDRVVDRILELVPAYATGTVSHDDLWWSVHRNLELNLLLIAERREVTLEELATRSQLGVRRAMAGIGVADLLRAFRTGYLMVWEALTERARVSGVDAMEALLDHTARVWSMLDMVSAAVEDAHRSFQAANDTRSRRQGLGFVAGLGAFPADVERTTEHARALGFDPGGMFLAAVVDGHLPAAVQGVDGVIVEQPDRSVMFVQPVAEGGEAEESLATTLQRWTIGAIGIGSVGEGLGGAQLSLRAAEMAHRVAQRSGREVIFRRDWFACMTCEASDLLAPLVQPLVAELDADEVANTVGALIRCGGNLTAAARELHVHPNTVSYRLERLRKITGIDLRQSQGMLDGHLALMLAGRSTGTSDTNQSSPNKVIRLGN
jgi:hypothetical protein